MPIIICSMHAYPPINKIVRPTVETSNDYQTAYRGGRVPTQKSYRDSRRRSVSPRYRRSPSPNRHSRRHNKNYNEPQDFSKGTGRKVHSACAVCLGRNPHDIPRCDLETTWNGHPTLATRVKGDLILRRDGSLLCVDWQRYAGCTSHRHDNRHLCSGCGQASHGAQNCPRAQKA
jgi:hypothetical protein